MIRILVVEDEEAIARMIAVNLEFSGYRTVVFNDGKEAAEALEQDADYNLALLDVMLPGMDGFRLFEVVHSKGIPAIFLTAKDDVVSKVTGLRGGAEDYIVKPFEVLELMVRIEKVLERIGAMKKTETICGLEVDFEAMQVKREGREMHLTTMEFRLLEVLIRDVIINLVDNAIKASQPGDTVWVAWKDGVLSVRDAGIGIPPEELASITEPFYMVDKSRSRKEGGAGLGLSLTKLILEKLGAVMEISSTPGEGTEISIRGLA